MVFIFVPLTKVSCFVDVAAVIALSVSVLVYVVAVSAFDANAVSVAAVYVLYVDVSTLPLIASDVIYPASLVNAVLLVGTVGIVGLFAKLL